MKLTAIEVSTLAGSGELVFFATTDGQGSRADFRSTAGITTDGKDLYVADEIGLVRKIVTATGKVSTLAGGGSAAVGVGKVATLFSRPHAITFAGNTVYVFTHYHNFPIRLIRKINLAGIGILKAILGESEKYRRGSRMSITPVSLAV